MHDPTDPEPLPTSHSLVVATSADLVVRPAPMLPGIVDLETERADAYARAARADNTQRAFMADWVIFTAWCEARGESALPTTGEVVRRFVAAEADAGKSPATIVNRRPKRTPYRRAKGTPFVEQRNGYDGRTVRAGCGVGRA